MTDPVVVYIDVRASKVCEQRREFCWSSWIGRCSVRDGIFFSGFEGRSCKEDKSSIRLYIIS